MGLDSDGRAAICDEFADVLIDALLLAHEPKEHPLDVIKRKLKINAKKYPPELARGNARKYTELPN